MDHLIFFPVLLPLITGVLLLLTPLHEDLPRQRMMVFDANAERVLIALLLLGNSLKYGTQVYMMGDWQAPFGIALVNDTLASVMLVLTSILAMAAHLYACAGDDENGTFFQPPSMFQIVGINAHFLTCDIFNLFDFFDYLYIAY